MKIRASAVACVLLMLTLSLFGQMPAVEYAYTSVERGGWAALFQVTPDGTLNEYDLSGMKVGSFPSGPYGTTGGGSPVDAYPANTFGSALNITPAAMNVDASNLFLFYVAPTSNDPLNPSPQPWTTGRLALGMLTDGDYGHSKSYDLADNNGVPVAVLATAPNVGGDLLPNNPSQDSLYLASVAIVGYATPDHTLKLDAWWMPQRQNGVSPVGQNLTSFTPTGTWDGNVSVAVRGESGQKDAAKPYGVYIAIRRPGSIVLGSAPMGQLTAGQQIDPPVLTWTTITPPDGITTGSTVLVQKGADNRLFLYYLNAQGQLASYIVGGYANAVKLTKQPSVPLNGKMTRIPSISYTLGPASTTYPDPTTPNMAKTEVPVYRTLMYKTTQYQNDPVMTPAMSVIQYGLARREPIGNITGKIQEVVGIIDGPPPVPNENIALSGMGNYTTLGTFEYGSESETGSDSTFTIDAGAAIKATSEAGVEGGVDSELNLKVGGGWEKDTSSTTTSLATYKSDAKAVSQNGSKPKIMASGVAFLYGGIWNGFRYHFLDVNGKDIPGSADRTVLFPTQVQIRPYPFDFNPNATSGIIPGELMTYVHDQTWFNNLKSKYAAYSFQNGSPTLYYGWSTGGTYGESASMMNTTKSTTKFNFSADFMIGGGEESPAGGFAFMAGAYFSLGGSSSTSTTSRTNITSSIDFPDLSQTTGVYTRLGYYTVPLDNDAEWVTELVTLLKSYPTANNKILLQQIEGDPNNPMTPSGTPWKFTYVITPGDYTFVQSSSSAMRASEAAPSVPLPRSLVARGIDTPEKLGQLQIARTEAAMPIVSRKAAAKSPVTQQIRMAASQLSDQEKQDIDAYFNAVRKERMSDFQRRHPNWKESAVPARKTARAETAPAPKPRPHVDFAALANSSQMMKARPRATAAKVQ